MQKIRLVIAIENAKEAIVWQKIFSDVPTVRVENIDFVSLRQDHSIDIIILSGWLAHERYGGSPRVGVSQILSTSHEEGMPPWVATIPAVVDDGEWQPGDEGELVWSSNPNGNQQETPWLLKHTFETIMKFDEVGTNPVTAIGFDPSLLFLESDPQTNALTTKQAYMKAGHTDTE